MKRHLRWLVCGISIVFLIEGCASESAVPVRQGKITAEEKEWLACRINAHLGHTDTEQAIIDDAKQPDGLSFMDGFQWGE